MYAATIIQPAWCLQTGCPAANKKLYKLVNILPDPRHSGVDHLHESIARLFSRIQDHFHDPARRFHLHTHQFHVRRRACDTYYVHTLTFSILNQVSVPQKP